MSLFPMKKRCENCHRKYPFNPDVGQIACPYCGNLNIREKILNDLKSDKKDKKGKKKE